MWNATPHVNQIPLQEQPTHNLRHTNQSHRPCRHTNRQEKGRKRPTGQGNTLDLHTIHHNTPWSQLYISIINNISTIIRTKRRNQQNPNTKETHNTTQHNTTHTRSHLHKCHPQKSTLPQRPARHQQYLPHQIYLTDNTYQPQTLVATHSQGSTQNMQTYANQTPTTPTPTPYNNS